MNLSLVITTCNRDYLLVQSLDRLKGLTLPDELIVVDDGGNDDTRQVAEDFARDSGVETHYIYTHNTGRSICSHARNVGIKKASHDIIVTSEPELCFRTDVLAQFARLQPEHPEEVISAGRIWFAPEGEPPEYVKVPKGQEAVGWVAPYAALWRKEWLIEIGGWDEGFPGPWGWDDTDLLTRLRLSGHGQHIATEIEAVHLYHGLGGDPDFINEKYFRRKSFMRDESETDDLIANKGRAWGIPKPRL